MKSTEHLKSVFAESFKFAIGDLVYLHADADAIRSEFALHGKRERYMTNRGAPLGGVVVQRMMEECHGGVQLHYTVRMRTTEQVTIAIKACEFELVSIDEARAAFAALAEPPKPA